MHAHCFSHDLYKPTKGNQKDNSKHQQAHVFLTLTYKVIYACFSDIHKSPLHQNMPSGRTL
jgi:hypothetical protein